MFVREEIWTARRAKRRKGRARNSSRHPGHVPLRRRQYLRPRPQLQRRDPAPPAVSRAEGACPRGQPYFLLALDGLQTVGFLKFSLTGDRRTPVDFAPVSGRRSETGRGPNRRYDFATGSGSLNSLSSASTFSLTLASGLCGFRPACRTVPSGAMIAMNGIPRTP